MSHFIELTDTDGDKIWLNMDLIVSIDVVDGVTYLRDIGPTGNDVGEKLFHKVREMPNEIIFKLGQR